MRLLVVHVRDDATVIGMGEAIELPKWPRGTKFHSSDTSLPLNDRAPRFFEIIEVLRVTSAPDVGIIEVTDAHIDRQNIPPIFVRGHRVTLAYHPRSDIRESFDYPAVWEVRLDGEVMGSIDGNISVLDTLGARASEIADREINRRLDAANSKY